MVGELIRATFIQYSAGRAESDHDKDSHGSEIATEFLARQRRHSSMQAKKAPDQAGAKCHGGGS